MQVQENITNAIESRDMHELRDLLVERLPADVAELVSERTPEDRAVIFRILPREFGAEVFENLDSNRQLEVLSALGDHRVALILNEMAADDRTAFFEDLPPATARRFLTLLSPEERSVALALLGYPENSVGRLMSPEYLAVEEDFKVGEVLLHIRKYGAEISSLDVMYVLDRNAKLIGELAIREVLLADPEQKVEGIMDSGVVSLDVNQDQEFALRQFKKYDCKVMPVVGTNGTLLGIVTLDDILIVAEEEATEDIHKLGGMEALDFPYLEVSFFELVKKRAVWLTVLFLGELLTASAMGYFEKEIERAVVLALFIPLIISSGGNSGSQAASLIIRALAVGEIKLRDWLRVFLRELAAGLMLGAILGSIGFMRILVWSNFSNTYGPHYVELGIAVSISLLLTVIWGTLSGAMLPFLLSRLKLDPATSSAPFVATLVDVTGLVIYFSVSSFFLSGVLL
jgi:magnesium transporter